MSQNEKAVDPPKESMIDEFKKFAFKGNVVDLAVGVIIGGAFGSVVKALTDWMIMPFLGLVTGGIDFGSLFWTLKAPKPGTYANLDEMVAKGGAVVVRWGAFINTIITFFLVSVAVFALVKMMSRAMAKQQKADLEAAAKITAEAEAKAKADADAKDLAAKAVEDARTARSARLESVMIEIRDLMRAGGAPAMASTAKKTEPA